MIYELLEILILFFFKVVVMLCIIYGALIFVEVVRG